MIKETIAVYILLNINVMCDSKIQMKTSYTTNLECRDGTYLVLVGQPLVLHCEYGLPKEKLVLLRWQKTFKPSTHHTVFEYKNNNSTIMPSLRNRIVPTFTNTGINLTIHSIKKEDRELPLMQNLSNQLSVNTIAIQNQLRNKREGCSNIMLNVTAHDVYISPKCISMSIIWEMNDGSNQQIYTRNCSFVEDVDTHCAFQIRENTLKSDEEYTISVYLEQYGVKSNLSTFSMNRGSTCNNCPMKPYDLLGQLVIPAKVETMLKTAGCGNVSTAVIVQPKAEFAFPQCGYSLQLIWELIHFGKVLDTNTCNITNSSRTSCNLIIMENKISGITEYNVRIHLEQHNVQSPQRMFKGTTACNITESKNLAASAPEPNTIAVTKMLDLTAMSLVSFAILLCIGIVFIKNKETRDREDSQHTQNTRSKKQCQEVILAIILFVILIATLLHLAVMAITYKNLNS